MTHITSKKPPPQSEEAQSEKPMAGVRDSTTLIRQLQNKLLALGQDADALPVTEIEKTAKAISMLIASVEKADAYLQSSESVGPGDGLSEPSRLDLLRKIKRMVANGVLDELLDEDDV